MGWWSQPALFTAPCFSRFQHCMTDPAFLVASLSPALITCTQPQALASHANDLAPKAGGYPGLAPLVFCPTSPGRRAIGIARHIGQDLTREVFGGSLRRWPQSVEPAAGCACSSRQPPIPSLNPYNGMRSMSCTVFYVLWTIMQVDGVVYVVWQTPSPQPGAPQPGAAPPCFAVAFMAPFRVYTWGTR